MKVENYFWLDESGKDIIIPKEGENYRLGGQVYGSTEFGDGEIIVTSNIGKRMPDKVETVSGHVYEFGRMHKDYQEILENLKREDIYIISRWSSEGRRFKNFFGYAIKEQMPKLYEEKLIPTPSAAIFGKVVSQDGNYLTLDINGRNIICLVIWRNVRLSLRDRVDIENWKEFAGMNLNEFSEYMFDNIRPNIKF